MFVGNLSFSEVSDALSEIQMDVDREINPAVFAPNEFIQRLETPFIRSILADSKIFLIGDEREFGTMVEEKLGRQA